MFKILIGFAAGVFITYTVVNPNHTKVIVGAAIDSVSATVPKAIDAAPAVATQVVQTTQHVIAQIPVETAKSNLTENEMVELNRLRFQESLQK